jgi:hypothetical protein
MPAGVTVDNPTAWKFYKRYGEHLGMFDTPEQATKASQAFHEENAQWSEGNR